MIRTYEFTVSTNREGSQIADEIEIEFEGNETPEEIEKILEEEWLEWRGERCEGRVLLKSE